MGCILAELVYCSSTYTKEHGFNQDNRFLFPGSSSFPLSPCEEMNNGADENTQQVNIVSEKDQMIKILNVLGKQQQESDCSFILDEGVMKYQQRIQSTFNYNSNSLPQKFPKSNPMIIDLLKQMLEFNPFYRPTAKECLASKVFD